ncbi:MAG: ribonuclease PH [Chloroflexi bacterium]|nr:ribonuclease PH [Chloroflexota bacterium]
MERKNGRAPDQLREVRIAPNFLEYAEGSVLIEVGATRVLCAVSVDNRVPPFLEGRRQGWITAEYGMLPRSTHTRSPRESITGRQKGRTLEIQRLIGRSLRSVADLGGLGERTLTVDCDVLQADGGTRTAAITGAYVAVALALGKLGLQPEILRTSVAAVSAGVVDGVPLLDLAYEEDCRAEVDFNVVMTREGEYVEVQGTGEQKPFSRRSMEALLALAERGISELIQIQNETIRQSIA